MGPSYIHGESLHGNEAVKLFLALESCRAALKGIKNAAGKVIGITP